MESERTASDQPTRAQVSLAHGEAADTVVDAAFYLAAQAYLAGPTGCVLTVRHLLTWHAVTPETVDKLGQWVTAVRTSLGSGV